MNVTDIPPLPLDANAQTAAKTTMQKIKNNNSYSYHKFITSIHIPVDALVCFYRTNVRWQHLHLLRQSTNTKWDLEICFSEFFLWVVQLLGQNLRNKDKKKKKKNMTSTVVLTWNRYCKHSRNDLKQHSICLCLKRVMKRGLFKFSLSLFINIP